MPEPSLLIVNPRSAGGATGRRARELAERLRRDLGALEVETTRGPGDAERIAREAVRAGVERLLVAGGDGTIHEVVSGLLAADLGSYARVGLLPFGTGGDLLRTLGLPRDLAGAIQAIAEGKPRCIDAGRVDYAARDGQPARSFFLNVGSLGLSGLVTELVNRAPKAFGPRVSYVLGTVRAIGRWSPLPVSLRADGEPLYQGPLTLAVAANGRYFGGGMQIAPRAEPDDGLFDLIVVRGLSRTRLLRKLPVLYRGAHLAESGVQHLRARCLEAESDAEVWIEIDGEPIGRLPARFEIVPQAITILGAGR